MNGMIHYDYYIIGSMFNDAAAFRQLGMPRVKSLLVHGVAGVGKSTIVRQVTE